MKKITSLSILLLSLSTLMAQSKDFEGVLYYKTTVKSKSPLISDQAMKTLLAAGNQTTVWIKQGNYRQSSGFAESYFITRDQREYYKFRGLDTLYYVEYNSDTSAVTNVSKPDEKRTIAGLECKTLIVASHETTRKYFYSPTLYMNPEYDKNNTLSRFDVFAKETSSLYLGLEEENKSYSLTETCTRVETTTVSDDMFKLPELPQKKFSIDEIIISPEFTKSGGWAKYIETNINSEVGSKYLRLSKGEESATQTVIVKFLVNEYGRVSFAEVENNKDVHPRLAEEALRVVNASPSWKAATIYGGEKTIYWMRAPITFMVTKK